MHRTPNGWCRGNGAGCPTRPTATSGCWNVISDDGGNFSLCRRALFHGTPNHDIPLGGPRQHVFFLLDLDAPALRVFLDHRDFRPSLSNHEPSHVMWYCHRYDMVGVDRVGMLAITAHTTRTAHTARTARTPPLVARTTVATVHVRVSVRTSQTAVAAPSCIVPANYVQVWISMCLVTANKVSYFFPHSFV